MFLEANGLLMHPDGVAVTMEDCEELARDEKYIDKWDAAATYASKMLPAIFRVDDPLMQIAFATDERIKLEELIDGLERHIFAADDALGWVYQYWQSEAKKQVEDEEKSGQKIDGARLPAKTQLFTEPYMVHFLIDNTIGSWWVNNNPGIKTPVKFEYLQLREDGRPIAEKIEGWPDKTADITALDPCMGSGHFVASLFPVFAKLRMHEEDLTKEEATGKVITENLFGLELDARCTQIAAFNLALTAWKFCGHYMELPEMNLACSGIAPKGKMEDWVKLVSNVDSVDKARMENGMRELYNHFQLAPELGSLIDPSSIKADAYTANFDQLQPILDRALNSEVDSDQLERGVLAAGIAKAGQILAKKYTLQVTNVPYLGRKNQDTVLLDFCEKNNPDAKVDLATVFLDKMLKSNVYGGISCCVIPQNWLFLTSYKKFREKLLKNESWTMVARLGPKSFQTPMWDFNVMLIIMQHKRPVNTQLIYGIDVSDFSSATAKEDALKTAEIKSVKQLEQLKNPDARIVMSENIGGHLLSKYANSLQGIATGDYSRYGRVLVELPNIDGSNWVFQQSTFPKNKLYAGKESAIYWENGEGSLHSSDGARIQGNNAWRKKGVVVSLMGSLPVSLYLGEYFDISCASIVPINEGDILAVWCFCSSPSFNEEVRKIDQKLNVTTGTLSKVPFDLDYWQQVAAEKYPNGLPKSYSDDATQWLFHGNPTLTDNPLQVAMARLLGYRWPAESDTEMELADEARELIAAIQPFNSHTDDDGIMCLPAINGELQAAERCREFLMAVWGEDWSNSTLQKLLQKEDAKKTTLDEWLRDEFIDQHNKLFQNRPFIWQIWDGRKDGFSALVNYHKLNKENLSKLIYTYLGDWIRMCEAKVKAGESGAEGLRSAALKLKEKLEAILQGEAPYDIFVRWKTLDQQPVGWEPDLNDGVRLNIRPFILADVLRKKPNIKWGVDRGKNPPGTPWGTERDNDMHLSLEEKGKSRK